MVETLLSASLPGYLTLRSDRQTDLQSYLSANTPKATLAGELEQLPRNSAVSLMKSFCSEAAQKRTLRTLASGYQVGPRAYDRYQILPNMMDNGNVTDYVAGGFNPVASFD